MKEKNMMTGPSHLCSNFDLILTLTIAYHAGTTILITRLKLNISYANLGPK